MVFKIPDQIKGLGKFAYKFNWIFDTFVLILF